MAPSFVQESPAKRPVGRLEQVEHQALAILMAAQAGVRVPEVVIAALGPDGDALVVTCQPDIDSLELSQPDQVDDRTLEELLTQVARLHAAGISHGALNASNVLVLDDGPMLVDFSAATLGAPQSALDMDAAELLVACTVLVGPDRALGRAIESGCGEAIGRVLPYLQRAALTPHLRDVARSHELGLDELRKEAAKAAGQEAPELIPLRRMRARDLALTAMVAVAAYLLITQLAKIDRRDRARSADASVRPHRRQSRRPEGRDATRAPHPDRPRPPRSDRLRPAARPFDPSQGSAADSHRALQSRGGSP